VFLDTLWSHFSLPVYTNKSIVGLACNIVVQLDEASYVIEVVFLCRWSLMQVLLYSLCNTKLTWPVRSS